MEVGYYGKNYWSGKYWYVPSEQCKRKRPIAVGVGETIKQAEQDLKSILQLLKQK